jgi:PKD repeat protein
VKATVILPKIVGGSENDSHYSAEIAGIVTIVNQKPEVTILPPWGPSGTDYYYKETLEFQAIASDPDSDNDEALTYLWDFGDGSMLDEQNFIAKPVHSYDLPGTYQVSLTVTDEFGESNTDIDPVKVGNNKPEVLSIRTDTGKTKFGKGEVKFIVDPKDEDITTLDYTWYFGDGSVATISGETSINHTFTRTGSIIVTCVAFDEFGGFGSNSLTITIENNAPVPVFNVVFDGKTYDFDDDKRIEIEEDDEVSFDASGSFDPDADHGDKIISYNWIFGDGTVGSGVQPTHIYKDKFEDGYEISLTITDSEGKQVTLKGTVLIVVKEKDVETPTYVYLVIAILVAFVLFLGVMFVRTPKRFFGAMKKGTAQAEMSALIDKLNVLEGKLGVGGAAAASSFAPGEQKFCDSCGAGNEMDGKFCESCGSPLT